MNILKFRRKEKRKRNGFPTDLVDIVLLLLGEAEDVVGLVGELHVLLVVDAVHGDLTLIKYTLEHWT